MFSTRFGLLGFTPPASPLNSNVVILLHFDDIDGSTTFTDSSDYNWQIYPDGSPIISTTQSKFGGSSLNGTVYLVDDPALDLNSSDWTIEMWYYQTGGGYTLAAQWGGINAWFLSHNHLYLNSTENFGWDTPSFDTWHHIAIVRKLNIVSTYIDGIMLNNMSFSGSITNSSNNLSIGGGGGQSAISGFIDDFRLTKNLAIYDGDFIPPTSALTTNPSLYTVYQTYGTLLFSTCVDGDLVGTYADGNGGRFTETISVGSCS